MKKISYSICATLTLLAVFFHEVTGMPLLVEPLSSSPLDAGLIGIFFHGIQMQYLCWV